MKELCLFPNVFRHADIAPIFLRLAMGLVFLLHGLSKFTSLDKTAGFFASIGIPAAGFAAGLVATIEFVGGIMLIAGFLTRQAAALLSIVMIVAIIGAKIKMGFPALDVEVALLGGALTLLFLGPGKWAIMHG